MPFARTYCRGTWRAAQTLSFPPNRFRFNKNRCRTEHRRLSQAGDASDEIVASIVPQLGLGVNSRYPQLLVATGGSDAY
jgi:hypothetical protein